MGCASCMGAKTPRHRLLYRVLFADGRLSAHFPKIDDAKAALAADGGGGRVLAVRG